MNEIELDAAIAWFGKREPPMVGARKMYRCAYLALKALKVDQDALEDSMTREQLLSTIHRLRASCISRDEMVDRLEDENYELRKQLNGGKDV